MIPKGPLFAESQQNLDKVKNIVFTLITLKTLPHPEMLRIRNEIKEMRPPGFEPGFCGFPRNNHGGPPS